MKQKTRAVKSTQVEPRQSMAAHLAAQRTGEGWGFRWHAGRFRTALWLMIAAAGVLLLLGQMDSTALHALLREQYVATRATVVKAPYWADALQPKVNIEEEGIAGWHVDLRVGEHPFTLAVALSDFEPERNSLSQSVVPDANKFAVGSVHPVWFYGDQRYMAAATVALQSAAPTLVISRAAYPRFPSLQDVARDSRDVLLVPAAVLLLAMLYLVAAFYGKRGGNTAGAPFASRVTKALAVLAIGGGAYVVNDNHPLSSNDKDYTPAQIEITGEPFPIDKLTHYSGYRVLWRTWMVQAKIDAPNGAGFTIDVDGLDPRRTAWASRHSPDLAAFTPGTKMPVWQSNFHSSTLQGVVASKPEVFWQTFLSRERWPQRTTWRDFVRDCHVASAIIALCVAMALVWLVPLGGRRGA